MSGQDKDARLVILDRDGVINQDSKDFIKSVDEWLPLPGSIKAIAALSSAGFSVAVASNQSGIARGLFTAATLDEMHRRLRVLVETEGGHVALIVYCPHGWNDNCACRKPRPGLLHQISDHFGVPLAGVPMVGDSLRDLEAAAEAGARPILVRSGNGRDTEQQLPPKLANIDVFDDLAAAAASLLE